MIHNLEITGDGATHTLAALALATGLPGIAGAGGTRPQWIQFILPSGNSGVARVGDVNTDSSHGLPLPAGSGQMFPPVYQVGHTYSLSAIYVNVANADRMSVAWEA